MEEEKKKARYLQNLFHLVGKFWSKKLSKTLKHQNFGILVISTIYRLEELKKNEQLRVLEAEEKEQEEKREAKKLVAEQRRLAR